MVWLWKAYHDIVYRAVHVWLLVLASVQLPAIERKIHPIQCNLTPLGYVVNEK